MNSERERLVVDYLEGKANEEEVRRLEQLLVDDREVARELLFAASMETHLHEIMGGRAQTKAPVSASRKSWPRFFVYAALFLLAVGGWSLAAVYGLRASAVRSQVDELTDRVEEFERLQRAQASEPKPPTEEKAPNVQGAPEVLDLRGLVLALPRNQEGEKPMQLRLGDAIPVGHALWTCPWGAAQTRYADGTSVWLDRSTTALLTDDEEVREASLTKGTLSVMRWPEDPMRGPMIVKTPHVSATLTNGQIAITISGEQTIVEVGMGEALLTRTSDGRTLTVPYGHYAVVRPEGEMLATKGLLKRRMEPVATAGAED